MRLTKKRAVEENEEKIRAIVEDVLARQVYSDFVAFEQKPEPGQIIIGTRHPDDVPQQWGLGVAQTTVDAILNAIGDAVTKVAFAAFVETTEAALEVMSQQIAARMIAPPVTKPGDVLTLSDKLTAQWGDKAPPPPPPVQDTLWRDLYCADAKGNVEYIAYKSAANMSGIAREWRPAANSAIAIRRVNDQVKIRCRNIVCNMNSPSGTAVSYLVGVLPAAGWLPDKPTDGIVGGAKIDGNPAEVKWSIPADKYQTGPGFISPPKGVLILADVTVTYACTGTPFPSSLDKNWPRPSKEQS